MEAVCVPEHLTLPGSLQAKQLHHLHAQLSLEQSCHRQKKKKVFMSTRSLWSCPTLCDPVDCGLPGTSLVPQRLKHLPPMQETQVRSLGQEDPLEKEMVTHSSILAWRIPWTEKPGMPQSTGSQRVRQDQSKLVCVNTRIFFFFICSNSAPVRVEH